MEATKITKNEFIKLLSGNKSIFLGYYHNWQENPLNTIIKASESIEINEEDERRTVKSVKSNSLLFSNGSSLNFDGEGEKSYYKIGANIICQIVKIDNANNNYYSDNNIVYSFGMYYIEF